MDSPTSYVSPFDSLRRGVFILSNPFMTFFEVTGADARTWLQGQLTNDVRMLSPSNSLNACMCSPTGQVIAILKLWQRGDSLILGVHNLGVNAVLERFDRMVILEDVALSPIDRPFVILQGKCAEVAVVPPGALKLELDQCGSSGVVILFESEMQSSAFVAGSAFPVVDEDSFRFMEIEAGHPRFGLDTDSKTLPAELGSLFLAEHVSFDKGCYTGQEVVMRIQSRGHVNRRWMTLLGDKPFQAGDEIISNESRIGKVSWSGNRDGRAFATAFLNAAQIGSEVSVLTATGETAVHVVAPPVLPSS